MPNLDNPRLRASAQSISRRSSTSVVAHTQKGAEKLVYQPRHAAKQSFKITRPSRANDLDKTTPNAGPEEHETHEEQLAGLNALFELSIPLVAPPTSLELAKQHRVLGFLSDPALRGAVALMLSAGMAGALGFVFWSLTAHHQDASAVGSVSAEVSSITFLATIGCLNLTTIFARFLPEAGLHTRRLILISYSGAVLASLLAAVIFLMTPIAAGSVLGGVFGRFAFVVCVVLNSVFNIQDGGLVGFGRFGWVPIENILVALARLALLPLAAMYFSARIGVLWSWALPMTIAVLVVNALIIGPLAGRQAKQRPSLPPFGELGRLIAVDSVTTSLYAAASSFLPALVTHKLGASQGGYFYVPWTIAIMAGLLLNNISLSMVREIVANPQKADLTIRRSLGFMLLVTSLIMIACLFLTNLVLAPLGSVFVVHGIPLMRWIGLAVPARAIIVLFWAVCLVRRRPWPVFALNIVSSGGIVGGVLLLGAGADISRVGMIYCLVQWVLAAVVSLYTFRALRDIQHSRVLGWSLSVSMAANPSFGGTDRND